MQKITPCLWFDGEPEDTPEGESQIEAIAGSFEELYEISLTFRQLADDQDIRI